jgi:hypothetical protein
MQQLPWFQHCENLATWKSFISNDFVLFKIVLNALGTFTIYTFELHIISVSGIWHLIIVERACHGKGKRLELS